MSSNTDLGNFNLLFDTFHQGEVPRSSIVGIGKDGALQRFEHDQISKSLDQELSRYSQSETSDKFLARISLLIKSYEDTTSESIKYVLCFYKGVGEYMKGEYGLAEKSYRKCLVMFDGDPQLYFNLGLLKMQKSQYSAAVNCFHACAVINPKHPNAINNIAYIYNLMKNYQATADICQEAYNNPKSVKSFYRNWAIALMRLEKFEEAEKVIRKAIKEEEHNEKNWVILSKILAAKENSKKVVEVIDETVVIKKEPETQKEPQEKKEVEKQVIVEEYDLEEEDIDCPVSEEGTENPRKTSNTTPSRSCCIIIM